MGSKKSTGVVFLGSLLHASIISFLGSIFWSWGHDYLADEKNLNVLLCIYLILHEEINQTHSFCSFQQKNLTKSIFNLTTFLFCLDEL